MKCKDTLDLRSFSIKKCNVVMISQHAVLCRVKIINTHWSTWKERPEHSKSLVFLVNDVKVDDYFRLLVMDRRVAMQQWNKRCCQWFWWSNVDIRFDDGRQTVSLVCNIMNIINHRILAFIIILTWSLLSKPNIDVLYTTLDNGRHGS